MSDYLCPLVLVNILSRLPVKTLLQLRCVCKEWYSLISSPHFINHHLNLNRPNNTHLLLRHFSFGPKKEHYSLRVDSDSFSELAQLKCPFKIRSGNFFRIVGSCNGLICLSDDTYTLIIWNPAIRKYVTLLMPRICFDSYRPYKFALGFGVDPNTNDHKVVRIALIQGDSNEGHLVPPEVGVYSLSTGVWKFVCADRFPYDMVEYFWSSAFINGALHWVVYNRSEEGVFTNRMLVFDLGSELFREIELPNELVHQCPLDLSVAVCGNTICVFWYHGRSQGQFCEGCAVWVMQTYGVAGSWSKEFFFDLKGGISLVLGFRKNGELLVEKYNGRLVSYDPDSNELEDLEIHGGKDSFYVGAYAESLVLLDAANGVLGEQLKSCDGADSKKESVLSQREQQLVEYELLKNSATHMLLSSNLLGWS